MASTVAHEEALAELVSLKEAYASAVADRAAAVARAELAHADSVRATARADEQAKSQRQRFEQLQVAVAAVAEEAEVKARELRELRIISVRWAREEVRLRGELQKARMAVAKGARDKAAHLAALAEAEAKVAAWEVAEAERLASAGGAVAAGIQASEAATAATKERPEPSGANALLEWLLTCAGCRHFLASYFDDADTVSGQGSAERKVKGGTPTL